MKRTGTFDKLIDIEKPAGRVSDGAGGSVTGNSFITVHAGIWAAIESKSASRKLQFAGVLFTEAYTIRVYKDNAPNLTRLCRVIYRGKPLTIHSITNEEETDWEYVILAYMNGS